MTTQAQVLLLGAVALVLLTVTAAFCWGAASDRRSPSPEPPAPSQAGGKGFAGAEFGPETDWTWAAGGEGR